MPLMLLTIYMQLNWTKLVEISLTLFPVDHPPCDEWVHIKGQLQQTGPFYRPMSVRLTFKVTPPTICWVSNWTGAVSPTPRSVLQASNYTSQDSMLWESCCFKVARTKTVLGSHCTYYMGCPILSKSSVLLVKYKKQQHVLL